MATSYPLSTKILSCKGIVGPLYPYQGVTLDPIFQIFPRFWTFLVGSTDLYQLKYSGNRLRSPRLRSIFGLHQQLMSVPFLCSLFQ